MEAERRWCACAEEQRALRQSSRGQTELFQGKLAKTKDSRVSGTAAEPPHSFQPGTLQPAVAKPVGEFTLSGIKLYGVEGSAVFVFVFVLDPGVT